MAKGNQAGPGVGQEARRPPTVGDALEKREQGPAQVLRHWFQQREGAIQALARGKVDPVQVIETALLCVQQNPQLASCTKETLFGGILRGLSAGLSFDPLAQEAYLIPRRDKRFGPGPDQKGVLVANFQAGYHGVQKLMKRHGGARDVIGACVFENDEFDIDLASLHVKHRPALRGPRGSMIGVYARVLYEGGQPGPVVWMSIEDVNAIRDRSDAYKSAETSWYNKPPQRNSPWHTDYERMAIKTAKLRLRHDMTLTPEAEAVLASDQRTVRLDGEALVTDAMAHTAPELPPGISSEGVTVDGEVEQPPSADVDLDDATGA